eukprot:5727517-Pleurochrysis_carterae.AAC.1
MPHALCTACSIHRCRIGVRQRLRCRVLAHILSRVCLLTWNWSRTLGKTRRGSLRRAACMPCSTSGRSKLQRCGLAAKRQDAQIGSVQRRVASRKAVASIEAIFLELWGLATNDHGSRAASSLACVALAPHSLARSLLSTLFARTSLPSASSPASPS